MERKFDIGDVVVIHDSKVCNKRNLTIEDSSIGIVSSGEFLERRWDSSNGEPSVAVFFGEVTNEGGLLDGECHYSVRVEDITYIGAYQPSSKTLEI